MAKKVAIMTFQRAHNYGSILQAHALQKYINEKENVDCKVIDFSNAAQQEMYRVFRKKKTIHNIIRNIITFFLYFPIKRQFDDFNTFIENTLILTDNKFASVQELEELDGQYDVFIAGSDQVWNVMCPDADDAYYLNFVKKSDKVAYAPSFGAENLAVVKKKEIEKYKKYLNSFKALSIREENGQKWIVELIGRKPKLLIDPTLFYDREYWQTLMSPSLFTGKFILYYSFHYSEEINKEVKKISKRLGMPVVILNARAWVFNGCALHGFKLAKHGGPAEFLRLINDAELVLSNSFHGTVFSVLFEKKFWFLYGSVQAPLDDRALTLVKQPGIENRVLRIAEIKGKDLMQNIDYMLVKQRIRKLRDDAFCYVKEYIIE